MILKKDWNIVYKKMAKESQSFQEFMNKIKTKRYTWDTSPKNMCSYINKYKEK